MTYKRISKGFNSYALYPKDMDIDEFMNNEGVNSDYYESIYDYKQVHYDKYINNLKDACRKHDIKFDKANLDLTNEKSEGKFEKLNPSGNPQLDYAVEKGSGEKQYEIVDLDS